MFAVTVPFFGTTSRVAASGATQNAKVEAVCPAPTPGTAQCLALVRTDVAAQPASGVAPLATSGGYGPADIQSAYALPSASAGTGLTVAVVDAGDLPTAEADLAVYRSTYGLPPCTTANGCFRRVNETGGTDFSQTLDEGWGLEIALDIDMVSAACPNCNILLVEANNTYFGHLGTAVNTAVALGAVAVSNSYGGIESSGQGYYDTHYYNHPGVAITVSTGDCGYDCTGNVGAGNHAPSPSIEYPAASPYVIAVGGTSLRRDTSPRGWTESAWGNAYGGAGSGCSIYEPKPAWQHDTGCSNRTQADVSAVADPSTGVAVYYKGGWVVSGGTSASSPIIAATFALAGRPVIGTYPASYLYGDAAGLNDVTSGNNDVTWGNCTVIYLCNGVPGYDGPTGLGTPNGTRPFSPDATYVPLTRSRILDSRSGNGLSGPIGSHASQTFQVSGRGGVPANATAVTGNLTATAQSSSGYLYVGPVSMNNPTSSSLNFPVGDDRANGVTVAIGAGGTLSITFVGASAAANTHVIFDVTGYFVPDASGATYIPLTPSRILDTRSGTNLSGPFSSHVARTFGVTGRGGVPTNATAVTGNLTVTAQTSSGYLYLGPVAMNDPTSSTLNFPKGDDRANGVTVAIGTGGTLSITYVAPSAGPIAQVIFDVTGYFAS